MTVASASVSNPAIPTEREWKAIARDFEKVVGKRGVVRRKEELLVYECDGLTSYRQRPALVVLPRTTEQVAEAVKVCDRHNVAFIARGAGTGLSGGALPIEHCVLIVTALMNKVLEVDLENQRVVVQPGVINNWVTQTVSGAGFY
ncbi:MAG: FAD-binding protein, partial [Cyanobacteria bacterium J06627_8]